MKAAPFQYHAPRSLAEALRLVGELENARVLAGGQSLMPMLNLRLAAPDHLIDLNDIDELVGVKETPTHLRVGAMTRQRAVERSDLVRARCPLLAEAVDHIGHQQTRNRGTIGGSLCHLDPGAELPVVALALDARVIIAGAYGEREIPFAEFPAGYLTSVLEPQEIATAFLFPKRAAREGGALLEFNRRPADFAIVSVAARLGLDAQGRVDRAAIAVGGVQYAPTRLAIAEAALVGRPLDEAAFALAARAADDLDCDGDESHPPDFRRDICGVLLGRALREVAARLEAAHV